MPGTPDHAITGFYARGSQDAQLKVLVGTKPNIASLPVRMQEGWITDVTQRTGRWITYFMPSGGVRRGKGHYTVRLQVGIWVFVAPNTDPEAQRAAITARLDELFDEVHWQHQGARLYAYWLAASDIPAGPDEPIGRRRDLIIEVS